MRSRLLLAAAAARVSGLIADASAGVHQRAMHQLRELAEDLFDLPPTELAQRRAQALATALRDIYAAVVRTPLLFSDPADPKVATEQRIETLQRALNLFLLTLASDLRIVLALRRAERVPPDLKAHLLVREPLDPDTVRVVARTTEAPPRCHRLSEVPFPLARAALERPTPENWVAVIDVARWVDGDTTVVSPSTAEIPCPEEFRRRWRSDPRVAARYGSAIVFQIPKPEEYLPDPARTWPGLRAADPVAALCIDCPARKRWRKDESDVLLSVAAPYLATTRLAVSALGVAWSHRIGAASSLEPTEVREGGA